MSLVAKRWPVFDQLRRDLTMVRRRLLGERPSPVHYTRPLASMRAASRQEPREVVVVRTVHEAKDTVTLVLRAAGPDGACFEFQAGQFFTLLVDVDGETVPRNYSASNAPGQRELCVTIKRKVGGRVSARLVEAASGDRLRILGPFGSFTRSSDRRGRSLLFVAGGVGITPLIAIARDVLAREPDTRIDLVYANRGLEHVAFGAELEDLAAAYDGRLVVRHVLESPPGGWSGEIGRLDRRNVSRIFDAITPFDAAEVFVCGPEAMQDEVLAALDARGVAPERIKREHFAIGSVRGASSSTAAQGFAADVRSLTIVAGKSEIRTTALPGASLLEAGLAASAPMAFSCGVGGCGACRVRLVDGEVDLEEPHCLSDEERRAGYVLACIGRPRGACTIDLESRVSLGKELPGSSRGSAPRT
jgi:ring-1,2-phenylacetyl-CoA epoxidase subunit PaaE